MNRTKFLVVLCRVTVVVSSVLLPQTAAGPGYVDVGSVGTTCSVSSSVTTTSDPAPDTTWGSPTRQSNDSLFALIRFVSRDVVSRGVTSCHVTSCHAV